MPMLYDMLTGFLFVCMLCHWNLSVGHVQMRVLDPTPEESGIIKTLFCIFIER
jgi:hypothetical protein